MDREKKLIQLRERLAYIEDVFGPQGNDTIRLLQARFGEFLEQESFFSSVEAEREFLRVEELLLFSERKLDADLTPMDRVRIVRHPQRICLKDILENVYDSYSELGGQGEYNIDPSILIARAMLSRRVGKRVVSQPVMVIGHEKGHGESFRNGGSATPWGNAKALHYMKVAETENIPIHTYVFTPGAYPVEDYPGAAQQIARNLYEMGSLRVPIVAVFSEGGSGGAEAISLADRRIMLSHGYYSVISPEGAAAIEGAADAQEKDDLVALCAKRLGITARDNRANGYVDYIVQEPPLGALPRHFPFFRALRGQVIQATNEVVSSVKFMKLFRAMALNSGRKKEHFDSESIYVRWDLNAAARNRLLAKRYQRFRAMGGLYFLDSRSVLEKICSGIEPMFWMLHSSLRHGFAKGMRKRVSDLKEEVSAEAFLISERVVRPAQNVLSRIRGGTEPGHKSRLAQDALTSLSCPEEGACLIENPWAWMSPRARVDKAISCPNVRTHGCPDIWAPDLYSDFAGVCPSCGHHFPMEYEWYFYNVFHYAKAQEFNAGIEAANPLEYPAFDAKLERAKKETGRKSSCVTFETTLDGIRVVVASLIAPFRGGTVGAAEGEKFILAAERAYQKQYPFIAYVHGTAGIRIQEGVHGVIQMPRCTLAVRRYIDAGGLYLVVYDTNSYAGPVASFLGCSPYQFAVRSSNIGFAGPGVIAQTTDIAVPPHYHKAYHALSRGHIHGVWDRRELQKNLQHALLTVGGRNLYYR